MRMSVIVVVSALSIASGACTAERTGTEATRTVTQPAVAVAMQEVEIDVTSEFKPGAIAVKQGQPVRLKFRRTDEPTCADEVVFPDLNLRKKLPPKETTVVEITPQKSGDLAFVCGMKMMKGRLIVQ